MYMQAFQYLMITQIKLLLPMDGEKKKKYLKVVLGLLAVENPADIAIEAVRGLRTSLHFAMMEARNNVLMISGASPNAGKTLLVQLKLPPLQIVVSEFYSLMLICVKVIRINYSQWTIITASLTYYLGRLKFRARLIKLMLQE